MSKLTPSNCPFPQCPGASAWPHRTLVSVFLVLFGFVIAASLWSYSAADTNQEEIIKLQMSAGYSREVQDEIRTDVKEIKDSISRIEKKLK